MAKDDISNPVGPMAANAADALPPVSELILEQIHEGICLQDIHGCIEWMNPACERMLGYRLKELKGRFAQDFILPPGKRQPGVYASTFTYDLNRTIFKQDIVREFQHRSGARFWAQQSFSILDLGPEPEQKKIVITCRDITNQINLQNKMRRVNDNLEYSAYHDDLTGLANRKKLDQFMASEDVSKAIAEGRLGIIQFDLEKFKNINDSLGHAAGDATLRHVATVLRNNSDRNDLTCRTGGDEFLVISLDTASPEALIERAQNLQAAISTTTELKDRRLSVETSIGASLATDPSETGEELVLQADKALFNAKSAGRGNIVLYTDAMGQKFRAQMAQIRELKTALDEEQFEIFLQPQMHLPTNSISGCEALIRWNHPEKGLLAPGQFLPNIERAGLGKDLDYLVMNLSLDALVELHENGFPDMRMSINVASGILADVNYPGLLDWALQSRNIEPGHVCVEILENTILDEGNLDISMVMGRLRRIGVRIALDDFGTGYAGLAHMSSFDVDAIKLDRSMVIRLDDDPRNQMIVQSIVGLCNQLQINVVAEGVETRQQLDILRQADCPYIQGYGLARPMSVPHTLQWLETGGATPDTICGTVTTAQAPTSLAQHRR